MRRFLAFTLLVILFVTVGNAIPPKLESPVITTEPQTTALDGYLYLYWAQAKNPDSGPIFWRLEEAPSGAFLYRNWWNPEMGAVVIWRPFHAAPGKYKFRLVADDGQWHETEQKWFVTVTTIAPIAATGSVTDEELLEYEPEMWSVLLF